MSLVIVKIVWKYLSLAYPEHTLISVSNNIQYLKNHVQDCNVNTMTILWNIHKWTNYEICTMEIRKQYIKIYNNKENKNSAWRGPLHEFGQHVIILELCSHSHIKQSSIELKNRGRLLSLQQEVQFTEHYNV